MWDKDFKIDCSKYKKSGAKSRQVVPQPSPSPADSPLLRDALRALRLLYNEEEERQTDSFEGELLARDVLGRYRDGER